MNVVKTSVIKNHFAYDLHSRYSVMMPSYCTVSKKGPVKGSVTMHRFPPLSKPEQRHQWLSGLDSGGKRCIFTAPLTGPFLKFCLRGTHSYIEVNVYLARF